MMLTGSIASGGEELAVEVSEGVHERVDPFVRCRGVNLDLVPVS